MRFVFKNKHKVMKSAAAEGGKESTPAVGSGRGDVSTVKNAKRDASIVKDSKENAYAVESSRGSVSAVRYVKGDVSATKSDRGNASAAEGGKEGGGSVYESVLGKSGAGTAKKGDVSEVPITCMAHARGMGTGHKIWYFRAAVLGVFIAFLGALSMSNNTYAATSAADLLDRVMANGIGQCVTTDTWKNTEVGTFTGLDSILTASNNHSINLPRLVGNSLSESELNINCKELFMGKGSLSGLAAQNSVSVPSAGDAAAIDRFLAGNPDDANDKGLGYNRPANGEQLVNHCVKVKYTFYDTSNDRTNPNQETNTICLGVTSDGKLDTESMRSLAVQPDSSKKMSIAYTDSTAAGKVIELHAVDDDGVLKNVCSRAHVLTLGGATWQDLVNAIEDCKGDLAGIVHVGTRADGSASVVNLYQNTTVDAEEVQQQNTSYTGEYTYTNDANANAEALSKVFSKFGTWTSGIGFNDSLKYRLYMNYIAPPSSVFHLSFKTDNCGDALSSGSNAVPVLISGRESEGQKWCEVDVQSTAEGTNVNIFNDGGNSYLDREVDIHGLISAIQALGQISQDELWVIDADGNSSEVSNSTSGTTPNRTSSGSNSAVNTAYCYDQSESLGWLLCEVAKAVSTTAAGIYDDTVEPMLAVDSGLFQDGYGIANSWQIFQNIANSLFAIFFLVVIFSQITGIGIDNYGIKRILPRLIVAAILINLSYLICLLAVDLSNIIGVGMKNVFLDMSDAVRNSLDTVRVGNSQSWTVPAGGIMIGILIPLLTVGGAVGATMIGGFVWIIPLILTAITALIAILFMFIVLGVRQAAIAILVVLSPLAFVAYMLPNTKSLFDRWRKMFTSMLIVYPICGIVIGGSSFASMVFLHTGTSNFYMQLAALLVSVCPFFIVPSLVKGSLDMMGHIGAKIMNTGSNLGRGANNAVRNSRAYKDTMARGRAGQGMLGAGKFRRNIAEGKSFINRIPGVGKAMQASTRRTMASGIAELNKTKEQQMAEEALLDPNNQKAFEAGLVARQEKRDTENFEAAIRAGNFAYTDENGQQHHVIDGSATSLANFIQHEGKKAPDQQNVAAVQAAYNRLRAQEKNGLPELAKAFNSGLQGDVYARLRDNIASDGKIKKQDRSLHMSAIDAQTYDSYMNAKSKGASEEELAAMRGDRSEEDIAKLRYGAGAVDKVRESGRSIKAMKYGDLNDLASDEYNHLVNAGRNGDEYAQEMAYKALANHNVNSGLNEKERREYTELAEAYQEKHPNLPKVGTRAAEKATQDGDNGSLAQSGNTEAKPIPEATGGGSGSTAGGTSGGVASQGANTNAQSDMVRRIMPEVLGTNSEMANRVAMEALSQPSGQSSAPQPIPQDTSATSSTSSASSASSAQEAPAPKQNVAEEVESQRRNTTVTVPDGGAAGGEQATQAEASAMRRSQNDTVDMNAVNRRMEQNNTANAANAGTNVNTANANAGGNAQSGMLANMERYLNQQNNQRQAAAGGPGMGNASRSNLPPNRNGANRPNNNGRPRPDGNGSRRP